ncbi:MAG: hypothetical protein QRY16_01705 [Enterobacterales bacterium endosymbiont of Blomia tropicalis]|uniref:hypothetical protein n=1 Tax=Mixta mediterraneensis TaxID=2758443 RepID=UPI0025A823D4|nr:hypothetical protein [Mixta mediterraneensis]MDL4912535.1 hypothetical protein [Mixta mediterraneensis]
MTSLLLAGSTGRVYLDYADNAAMTTNLFTVNESPNGTGGVLNVTNIGTGNVGGMDSGREIRSNKNGSSQRNADFYIRERPGSASVIVINIISRRPEYQPGGYHKHHCNPANCPPHNHLRLYNLNLLASHGFFNSFIRSS